MSRYCHQNINWGAQETGLSNSKFSFYMHRGTVLLETHLTILFQWFRCYLICSEFMVTILLYIWNNYGPVILEANTWLKTLMFPVEFSFNKSAWDIYSPWRMMSSGILRHVALVRTDVSEKPGASFIRVTRIGELGTTQAATSNRHTLRRNTKVLFLVHRFLSPWWRRRQVPPQRRYLQEPQGVTSQKTPFFIVTAVKTSNLTSIRLVELHAEI
jgi:hypothetical protein